MDDFSDLPPDLGAALMRCLREIDGEFEVADMEGLVKLIAEHGEQYPVLLSLVTVNEEAVVAHFKETGEVPPGIKLIGKIREGEKVTRLEVIHGPKPPDRPKS